MGINAGSVPLLQDILHSTFCNGFTAHFPTQLFISRIFSLRLSRKITSEMRFCKFFSLPLKLHMKVTDIHKLLRMIFDFWFECVLFSIGVITINILTIFNISYIISFINYNLSIVRQEMFTTKLHKQLLTRPSIRISFSINDTLNFYVKISKLNTQIVTVFFKYIPTW